MHDMNAIISQFLPAETQSYHYEPYGAGHINDTFLVRSNEGEAYLLQRINHQVYADVTGMMDNIRRVTEHLRHKLESYPDNTLTTLQIIPTHDGALFYQDDTSSYWRMITFIRDGVSYEVAPSPALAQEAGRAFGQFQALLSDLPGPPLHEVIPQFHHMDHRLHQFEQALTADPVHRVAHVDDEIQFVRQRAKKMLAWYQLIATGQLPLRVTHNDTKLNNVLLDPTTHRVRCVVDLDTVMPGSVLYDFGDAIRTTANTAVEDEPNLDRVQFSLPYYEAFTRGYLSQALSFLTDAERIHLPFSAQYMTFIMGLRMLTDYLSGDVYYKIHHPEHNLQRARAQFQLVLRMEEQYEEMVRVVEQLT